MNKINKEWYSSLKEVINFCLNADVDTDADDSQDANRQNVVLPPVFINSNKNDNVSIVEGLRIIAKKSSLCIFGDSIHEVSTPPEAVVNIINDEIRSKSVTNNSRVYNTYLILN
jgi:hypothetical protein